MVYTMLRDYELTHCLPSKLNCDDQGSEADEEGNEETSGNQHRNMSIQLGILIKAYGMMGEIDLALKTFMKHQSEKSNNDITFGCLIDAYVNNGNIELAEEKFNQIQNGGWMGIRGNTIIYTTMIKAFSQTY